MRNILDLTTSGWRKSIMTIADDNKLSSREEQLFELETYIYEVKEDTLECLLPDGTVAIAKKGEYIMKSNCQGVFVILKPSFKELLDTVKEQKAKKEKAREEERKAEVIEQPSLIRHDYLN
jgi:hypothetical protein